MASDISITRQGPLALVSLRSTDGYPKLTTALLAQLDATFRSIIAHSGLCGVVLTGTDTAFATGADIAEVGSLEATSALPFSALGQGLMNRIERSPKPVIAAIRGYCLGGGFDLAMACHLRLAAPDAVFAHPGGTLGLLTGFGGTERLPRLIGRARAIELLTTGKTITAEEAYRIFLVNRVVEAENLLPAAMELAARASKSSSAYDS